MGDIMHPIPFEKLVERIVGEYRAEGKIFGIPESRFFKKSTPNRINLFREACDMPIGPAAGPHTQLAQSIITSYLVGGRFLELKTVQQLDNLDIEKPCIDAFDECFNTEWSTELTLDKAYAEYVKAWVILHLLDELLGLRISKERSFMFNMSVGYDLAGIQTEKMDSFINAMLDASEHPLFVDYIDSLSRMISRDDRLQVCGKDFPQRISSHICSSVTLSTMHGCPPDEIESICVYLMEEKNLDCFVKLNPTLLGFKTVRSFLDRLGYHYIGLKEDSFNKDIRYTDALDMLTRVQQTGEQQGLHFGVKLSNTLGTANNLHRLPGSEMYMSGRALYPLTINVAAKLAADSHGSVPISYCGGLNSLNCKDVFACGIRPITMATEMLKPGGYLRLQDAALELEELDTWEIPAIDVSGLEKLAEKSLEAEYTQKQWRGFDTVSVPTSLPLFDCYIAPCVHACPIGQDVPQYIKLVKEKKYKEALELIREKNALPSITAHICDHQCMFNCNRLHHEGAVRIRDMKLLAVQQGGADTPVKKEHTESHRDTPVAIIGAGPAGLAAAYFLARDGFPVTIFEKEHTAGGVVHTILPRFRIPREAIEQDIDYIRSLGVEFVFRSSPHITIADLKKEGYTYVLIAIGAQKGASISLSGDKKRVIASLDFLKSFNQDPDKVSLGSNVVVVGGGNTAMDSARAATRVSDVDSVTVIYRRSEAEMPADREEYENALRDGVKFHFLLNPESISEDGTLSCRLMKLGEPDASGRKRPVATDIVVDQYADTLITAIGERVDKDVLKRLGLLQRSSEEISVDPATLETGTENVFLIGDARRGPSTVVECIQEARTAAEAIIDKGRKARPEEMAASPDSIPDPKEQLSVPDTDYESLMNRKAGYRFAGDLSMDAAEYAFNEGQRCLECDSVCNICVDVCPNRANVAIPTAHDHNFRNRYQILHLDSYCNECGNCATFCPYEGKPYTDKFTLFDLLEDFEASSNNGFLIQGRQLLLRLNGQILEGTVHENGSITIETQPEAANEKELTRAREFIEYLLHSYTYLFGPVQP